ncbi:MAG TPA: FHA domain-containing protein [Pyrinomonadaceae bacterium]
MPSHFTLTYEDEDGRRRAVAVDGPRFHVGRGEENDLRLGVAGLSRRHAMLELIAGRLYLSDTGSSNGTTVNGQPVRAAVEVYHGDVIVLGEACALHVSNGAPAAPDEPNADAPETPPPAPEATTTKPSTFGPHVFVGGLVGLVLLAGVVLLALYFGGAGKSVAADDEDAYVAEEKSGRKSDEGTRVETSTSDASARKASTPETVAATTQPSLTTQPSSTTQPLLTTQPSASAGSGVKGELERDAVRRVMSRISNDDSPYISDEGARDVARKVKEFGGSSALAGRMRALARGCAELTALARANNLRPSLLAYAALAESESGGDPVEAARRMAPKLLTLRATFGTETANSALLLVAAYPYPFDPVEGERKHRPHPLAARLVKVGGEHPEVAASVARSVWFLREKNGVSAEGYELVVRLLAVGVIAQRPGEYGLDAPPVLC